MMYRDGTVACSLWSCTICKLCCTTISKSCMRNLQILDLNLKLNLILTLAPILAVAKCHIALYNLQTAQLHNSCTNCSSSHAHALNVTEAIDYMSLITVHCALMTLTSVMSRLNPRSDCMSMTLATACPHTSPRQCIHRHEHTGTQRDIHVPCSSPCTQTHRHTCSSPRTQTQTNICQGE